MFQKKDVFTIITPIPGFIPRQLAIDILHSHSEMITLNPLVISHKPIPAPRNAAADEYYSTWYEIEERIQYIPGTGRAGSGRITFTCCFHDMPWGLQTHILAPLGVDLRNKFRVDGNEPGEIPQVPEMGLAALGAPSDGLYLREDVEVRCNIAVIGFVKKELKAACGEMVQRIIKKAELLDAGVLQAMFENGKLRTLNPNDRSAAPAPAVASMGSPDVRFATLPSVRHLYRRPMSQASNHSPSYPINPSNPSDQSQPDNLPPGGHQMPYPTLVSPYNGAPSFAQHNVIAELPGELYQQIPVQDQRSGQPSPVMNPSPLHMDSQYSQAYRAYKPTNAAQDGESLNNHMPAYSPVTCWSHNSLSTSKRTSLSSVASSAPPQQPSPGLQSGFAAELSSHQETADEYRQSAPLEKHGHTSSLAPQAQSPRSPSHKAPLHPPPEYSSSGYMRGDHLPAW